MNRSRKVTRLGKRRKSARAEKAGTSVDLVTYSNLAIFPRLSPILQPLNIYPSLIPSHLPTVIQLVVRHLYCSRSPKSIPDTVKSSQLIAIITSAPFASHLIQLMCRQTTLYPASE